MNVTVLGAGVIGVTTAYYLAERGCTVTVVDRAPSVASETSFANGGQLSYSFTDAMGSPRFALGIPSMVLNRDPAVRIRLSPELCLWGTRFLRQCSARRAAANTLAVLEIARESAQRMEQLAARLPFDFARRGAGKLVLLGNRAELDSARRSNRLKNAHGGNLQLLDRDRAIAIEPALAALRRPFLGAVYSRGDEVADAHAFTLGLSKLLEDSGRVRFRMNTPVAALKRNGGRITGVDGVGDADAVVVCLGPWSGALLKTVGINPHIYPVRGYSVTLPPGPQSPRVSITSLSDRMVFSRINGAIRIAGFADFGRARDGDKARRIRQLAATAESMAPAAADYSVEDFQGWQGLRAFRPDGQPLVGGTSLPGLYVNTGHGMLGWTLACATASRLADRLTNDIHPATRPPPLDGKDQNSKAKSPAGAVI